MNQPTSTTVSIFALAICSAWATACLEIPPSEGPEVTAQNVCLQFTECTLDDDASRGQRNNFFDDCVDLHLEAYDQIQSQLGAECLEVHLETEECYAALSCEDWEDDVGCEDKLEDEEEVCGQVL